MPAPEGTGSAFSTDPHLNESITSVLAELDDSNDEANGANADPSQDGAALVESSQTPADPSPGDRGEGLDRSAPSQPAAAGDPSLPPEPEPQTEPFGYTVNGEAKSIGEFFRIPGEGVFVPEAQVPRLQQLASRADANEAHLRELHDKSQAWDRLTQWTIPGPNGQQQTISGLPAFEMQRVALDQMAAVVQTYRAYMTDPAKLASLLVYDQNTGQFSIDPDRQRMLQLETKDAARDAESRVRTWLHSQGLSPNQRPAAAQDTAPTPAQISAQVAEHAPSILTGKIQEWGLKGLTQAHVDTLARQLPRYVRTATAADVQQDPSLRLGAPVLENEFEQMVRAFAQSIAGGATAAQAQSVAQRFNTGQQKGRAGQRPAAPVAPPAPPAKPEKRGRRHEKTGSSWDQILERGMNDPDVQAALAGG